MNGLRRFTLTGLAGLLLVAACSEPPVGSITGKVSIEGEGIDGVTVTLSTGLTTTTSGGGSFRFDGVEAGPYTVTISGLPSDANFRLTSAAVIVHTDGQVHTLDFTGTWFRTSVIRGTVTAENDGVGGVTLTISGMGHFGTVTGADGAYEFANLRAGTYTLEISGFDAEDVEFGPVSTTTTVAVHETRIMNFEGTYVRTSAIRGQVALIDAFPLEGVTVSVVGRGDNLSVTTNPAGMYLFEELRAGDYAVGISGYPTEEYRFDVTSVNVTIGLEETATADFAGIMLRTAAISGQVTVSGDGLGGVHVTVDGEGENHVVATDSRGEYTVDYLQAGDYTVTISEYGPEYSFDVTTKSVSVGLRETATVSFEGQGP